MNILVTGGAGYIGSHTCVELLNAGHGIVVVDNLQNSSAESLDRVRKITQRDFSAYDYDLLNTEAINSVFSHHKIDAVIHFAGLKAVGESVQNPLDYYHNNVTGTVLLCKTMQMHNVRRLVFSSSATVYGAQDRMPLTEDMPLSATNPYGWTKVMIEQILRDLYVSDPSWGIALLRYFNPVGAHKSGLIGEDPNGIPNNLVPYIAKVAVGKLPEVKVFGNDYPTVDGTGVRDYIHVVDLALGHLKAVEWVERNTGVDAFNLGTGKGYSVLEVIHAYEQASEVKIPYRIVDRRPGDVAVNYSDPTMAHSILKWQATKELLEMCEDSWKWQRLNPNGYTPSDYLR